jgi:hypothetical protein
MRQWRHIGVDGIAFLFDTVAEELKIKIRYDHDTYNQIQSTPDLVPRYFLALAEGVD